MRLNGIIEFFLADGAFLGERRVAVDVLLRFYELGLRLRQLAQCLVQGCLKLARVKFEQQITLFHESPFGVGPFHEIAAHLRPYERVV